MQSKVLNHPDGFTADIITGPSIVATVEEYELYFARRALRNVKERLGLEKTESLFQPDINKSREFWDQVLKENTSGEFKPSEVELNVKGITAAYFFDWFMTQCMTQVPDMLAAEPEHWVIAPPVNGSHRVVENLGPWISRIHLQFVPPSQPWQLKKIREDFPLRITGYGEDDASNHLAYVLHQFRPHSVGSGFDAHLCIFFPMSTPEEIIEQHRQHLVVEFTGWFRRCFEHLEETKANF